MGKIIVGVVAGVFFILATIIIFLKVDNDKLKLQLNTSYTNILQLQSALKTQNESIQRQKLEILDYKKQIDDEFKEYQYRKKPVTTDNCIGVLEYFIK